MDELFQDIRRYIDLRFKRAKLQAVENLSVFCSRAIVIAAFLLMLLLAVLTLTGALVAAVSNWIGSLPWAFVIVGGAYLIAALIFYLLRKHLFVDSMVRMFSRMFYGHFHGTIRPITGRSRDMISISAHSITNNFGINFSTTLFGMFIFFK